MKRIVSVVRLIVAIQSSGPPASGKIIKEMPCSVPSGTPYIYLGHADLAVLLFAHTCLNG